MIAISTRELTQSGDKYFDLAQTQPVYLRRRKKMFILRAVDDNPSPSGDPYFLNADNLSDIEQGAQQVKDGKITRLTPDIKKHLFGDV
ncbi:hypothetical protein FACS1894201_08510 [Bacteroidia bacterium]|nr:hypothetical protein FACS1894201_08510 [Bacteroidia bacterium]